MKTAASFLFRNDNIFQNKKNIPLSQNVVPPVDISYPLMEMDNFDKS